MNAREEQVVQELKTEPEKFSIPVWEKYSLTVDEAARYFRIGENKLRRIINENPEAEYLLWNGSRAQFKRVKFEDFLDELSAV